MHRSIADPVAARNISPGRMTVIAGNSGVNGAKHHLPAMALSLKVSIALSLCCWVCSTSACHNQHSGISQQSPAGPSVQTYGYVFVECTGITTHILQNGTQVPIAFDTEGSDSVALLSLRALTWNVLYPNSKGDRILLIGQYHPESHYTPDCKVCAQSEEYHLFTLMDWYILVPFSEWQERDGDPMAPVVIVQRESLEDGDFESFFGKDRLDIKRFQRPVQ